MQLTTKQANEFNQLRAFRPISGRIELTATRAINESKNVNKPGFSKFFLELKDLGGLNKLSEPECASLLFSNRTLFESLCPGEGQLDIREVIWEITRRYAKNDSKNCAPILFHFNGDKQALPEIFSRNGRMIKLFLDGLLLNPLVMNSFPPRKLKEKANEIVVQGVNSFEWWGVEKLRRFIRPKLRDGFMAYLLEEYPNTVKEMEKKYIECDSECGQLVLDYFKGDTSVLQQIIERNEVTIKSVAKKFIKGKYSLVWDDLIQEITLALIEELIKFQWWRNIKFQIFLNLNLYKHLIDSKRVDGSYPTNLLRTRADLLKRLENELGEPLTPTLFEKIKGTLNMQEAELITSYMLSLDWEGNEHNGDYGGALMNRVSHENTGDKWVNALLTRMDITKWLASLSERDQDMAIRNLLLPIDDPNYRTQTELGEMYGFTESWASHKLSKARKDFADRFL